MPGKYEECDCIVLLFYKYGYLVFGKDYGWVKQYVAGHCGVGRGCGVGDARACGSRDVGGDGDMT